MKKFYVSPLFAELELELENVLYDSEMDNEYNDADEPGWDNDFGQEDDDFSF